MFHGDDVLVTNLWLDVGATPFDPPRTVNGPSAAQVKLHTISKIKKRVRAFRNNRNGSDALLALGAVYRAE